MGIYNTTSYKDDSYFYVDEVYVGDGMEGGVRVSVDDIIEYKGYFDTTYAPVDITTLSYVYSLLEDYIEEILNWTFNKQEDIKYRGKNV